MTSIDPSFPHLLGTSSVGRAVAEGAAEFTPHPHPLQQSVRLPSTAHLRALEASARLGSFERASHELAVTPSAVAKRVAALESLLGIKLLSRVGRGVEPTPSGREYLDQVSVALGLLTRSTFHRRGGAGPLQRLRITTAPTFGRDILVPQLAEFSAMHPQIELELMISIPYMDITAPGCDLEIRFGDGQFDGLECAQLTDETVFPVATPEYLAQLGSLKHPAELLRKAVLLRCPLEPWQPWLEAARLHDTFESREPTVGHRFVDLGMMLESVSHHQGVGLARRSFVHRSLRDGRLRKLFQIEAKPRFSYYVCWHRKHGLDEAKLKFIEWLQSVCVANGGKEG